MLNRPKKRRSISSKKDFNMKEITIEIDKDGNTKVATSGYRGKECKQATKAIEDALGMTTSDESTAEMELTYVQQSTIAKH